LKNLTRIAAAIALGLLAFFLLRPPGTDEHRVILESRAARAAFFGEDATLRNVTQKDLRYTIEPNPYSKTPQVRTLRVGAVDRIATDIPVEVTFDSGARRGAYTIFPGKPYSFRYDEYGLIKVYPGAHGRADAADLAPYVPTPPLVIDRMLALAGVTRNDVVYDLGCGDGRMVIAAAKTYGARGVGIEIDAKLVEECRANAKKAGVAGLVRFIAQDATKSHISEATVVAVYLLPESLETLEPLFARDLRPGARIVSHNYRIPGWDERILRQEVVQDERGRSHKVLVYKMPETK
jgi:hypothetical protein